MSLPAGHNPNVSMLQGGEGASIVPNQAGGGMLKGGESVPILPSHAGGGLLEDMGDLKDLDDVSPEDEVAVKRAAAAAYLEGSKNPDINEDELISIAIEAANDKAHNLLLQQSADD